jgi:hypothetical protein
MGQRAIPSRISRHSYHPGEQTVKSKKLDYRVHSVVLWLLGLVASSPLGGFIPLLLLSAVVVLVMQLMQGRTPPV